MEAFSTDKPWGSFRQFTHNENSTVKLLFVKAGQELSLQTHKKRSEFWYVVKGNPELVIGEDTKSTNPGDEFTIPVGEKHRIRTLDTDTIILEVASGDFDENDIIRLEDKYGRT